MTLSLPIRTKLIGPGRPCFVIAEIGINHNGDVDQARRLIDAAANAGCDAVKFQKRTPEICVPESQKAIPRETPWGVLSYLEYRERIELDRAAYREIDAHCRERSILWFSSCWDLPAVDFMEEFDPPAYKIASATLTDRELLERLVATGRPLILSTGMSSMRQIRAAVEVLRESPLALAHCTSAYPCPPHELNLRMIETLRDEFEYPIGYSGHEVGLATTVAAVALGACFVERHITLDRSSWGSDQAASAEPQGIAKLVQYIRVVEQAMGKGVKEVYESELPVMRRLRRLDTLLGREG